MKKFPKIFLVFLSVFIFLIPNISLAQNMQVKEFSGAKVTANGDEWFAKKRINFIEKTLNSIYFPFRYDGLSVFIDEAQKEPRGQIRGKEMKLSAIIQADAEFIKLFTHELGHFIDIYVLRASPQNSDPSLDFYKISWKNPKTKHASSGLSSFVSGYAATNQYEDFAESFVWYVFHNEKFLDAAMKNEEMRLKYLFFSDNVFKK